MELNPNNPVARAAHGKWHLICSLVMHKLGVSHIEIKSEDVDSLLKSEKNIGIADDKGYIEIFLLTKEEAKQALKKYGGRPEQS